MHCSWPQIIWSALCSALWVATGEKATSCAAGRPSASLLQVGSAAKKSSSSDSCHDTVIFDIGEGASGQNALMAFFGSHGFDLVVYECGSLLCNAMIKQDLANDKHDLPMFVDTLKKRIASAKISRQGNIYVGDLKPATWGDGHVITSVLKRFRAAFPEATFVLPIRHPVRWAQSVSHWFHVARSALEKEEMLCDSKRTWLISHCAMIDAFGDDMSSVPIVTVDKLDWPLFKQELRVVAPNAGCLHGALPHTNSHPPLNTYVAETANWHQQTILTHLKTVCPTFQPGSCEPGGRSFVQLRNYQGAELA